MHSFASRFIRSDARSNVAVINPLDGNPVTAYFFLLKKNAGNDARKIVQHLYSKPIGEILENTGTLHGSNYSTLAKGKNIRWIGWDTVKNASLPYLKEY